MQQTELINEGNAMQNENGWDQQSRLVLKELETLAKSIQDLQREIGDLKGEISELKAQQDKVSELVQWKQRIDDVASPVQFKEMQQQIEEFKVFKTKAITIFVVVQSFVGLALGLIKYF